MMKLVAAQIVSGDAMSKTMARTTEYGSSSWSQADCPSQQMTVMTSMSCCQTQLAPGFVLWTPATFLKENPVHGSLPGLSANTVDRQDSLPSSSTNVGERDIGVPSSSQELSVSTCSSSPVLVIMFTWLFCTPHNAAHYIKLYKCRGWHVLHVSSQLMHFLWPPRSHRFALLMGRVLRERCGQYRDVLVHAMSIGAYNYNTCLMLAREQCDLQTYLFDKLRAVVFDSLTMGSLQHMVQGISTGVSQWRLVQTATRSLAGLYFFLTHQTTVKAFEEGVTFFRTCPARVPTLVFGSETDPMCEVEALRSLLRDWGSGGGGMGHGAAAAVLPSLWYKVWEKSGHCAHLLHHGHEYRQLLNRFLLSLDQPSSCISGEEGAGNGGGCGQQTFINSKL